MVTFRGGPLEKNMKGREGERICENSTVRRQGEDARKTGEEKKKT